MKRIFLVLVCLFPATIQAQQPQKIAAYNDFFTTMDWIAYDQHGTYGRGGNEQEAIEDCRKEYAMRLRAVGIKEEPKVTNERKNITQPPDWWKVFENEAKKAGVSLSEWIGEACIERLPVKVRKQLSDRPPANRPKKQEE